MDLSLVSIFVVDDDVILSVWEFDASIEEGRIAADNNCLSASWILCCRATGLLAALFCFSAFDSLEGSFSKPAF